MRQKIKKAIQGTEIKASTYSRTTDDKLVYRVVHEGLGLEMTAESVSGAISIIDSFKEKIDDVMGTEFYKNRQI
jgi:hypothetical protein